VDYLYDAFFLWWSPFFEFSVDCLDSCSFVPSFLECQVFLEFQVCLEFQLFEFQVPLLEFDLDFDFDFEYDDLVDLDFDLESFFSDFPVLLESFLSDFSSLELFVDFSVLEFFVVVEWCPFLELVFVV